jgi:hypothetical protein
MNFIGARLAVGRRMRICSIALLAILAAASPVAAQSQSSPPPSQRPSSSTPDFLFGQPRVSVAVRGGWVFSRAGSDWYDFVTNQLTLDKHNFNTPSIAADVNITLNNRLDAVVGIDYGGTTSGSEYRHFVDNNGQPINQETTLGQLNITGGVKFALLDRGRRISSFAWIPRGVVPYVGAGGGMVWYHLEQKGDFVDYVDYSVFTDLFESRGWAPTAHVMGGVDVRVARKLYVTVDARYRWAAADLSSQWVSFDPIDLSGLRLSAGVNVAF